MVASGRFLRALCWALVVLVVVSAVLTVGLSQNLFVAFPNVPDTVDLVDRLVAFRGYDIQVNTLALIASLANIGVFLLVALLGVALRNFARGLWVRDAMATLFVLGASVGIVAQLVLIGVNQAATYGYCDCGYRPEEVISQDYVLGLGWTVQNWLAVGAITIVGAGAALAGLLVNVSPAWKMLSYLIAAALLLGAVLEVIGMQQIAQLVVGITSGILVPIWAVMLALSARRLAPASVQDINPR